MSFRRFLLLALLVAKPALGEPVPGGQVRVERTERAMGCPSEQALVRQALAHGASLPPTSRTPLEVSVRFDGDPSSLSAVIQASGAKTGERVLRTEGVDCAKLAEATAVVVAVLLDLVAPEAEAPFEAPAAAAPMPAQAEPPPPVVLPPSRPPSPSSPPAAAPEPVVLTPSLLSALVRGEGMLTLGFLGGAFTPAVDVAASLRRGRWEGGLGVSWLAPREAPFTDIAGTKVDLALTLAFVEGCRALVRSQQDLWDGWLCARAAAGRLTGTGQGFDHTRASHALWVGAGPGLAFRLRITRVLSLRASLNGLVTLADHSFVVDGYGAAFDTPRFSAALGVGPELSIL